MKNCKKMKILLIFPPKTKFETKEILLPRKIDDESGNYPPLGLLYLASYVVKNSDHSVEIIDAPTENISYDELKKIIEKKKPDVVGIYFCTMYLRDAIATAILVKDVNKHITIAAGGPHVFVYPKETINLNVVDYCIYGEGEVPFFEITKSIRKKQ